MGTHCSSELRRGHRNITMKLLLLTVFAAVALAEEVAEVEEVAKSAVVPLGYGYHPFAYNQFTGQHTTEMDFPPNVGGAGVKGQLIPPLEFPHTSLEISKWKISTMVKPKSNT